MCRPLLELKLKLSCSVLMGPYFLPLFSHLHSNHFNCTLSQLKTTVQLENLNYQSNLWKLLLTSLDHNKRLSLFPVQFKSYSNQLVSNRLKTVFMIGFGFQSISAKASRKNQQVMYSMFYLTIANKDFVFKTNGNSIQKLTVIISAPSQSLMTQMKLKFQIATNMKNIDS